MRLLCVAAAAFCALAGQASAETYRANAVSIENTAAVLRVIPEDRSDVEIQITQSGRLPTVNVTMAGNRVQIDGGLRNRIRGCTSWNQNSTQVRVSGIGNVATGELTQITIRTPRRLDLTIGGAVFATVGASEGGAVSLRGCGDTQMADASGALDLELSGSGDAHINRVGGALSAVLTGSGSMRVERADAEAALRLTGSGDLVVGDIGGDVDARLTGSGELRAGSIDGGARLSLTGSGDLDAGAVHGALTAELLGSGGLDVASINGPSVELRQTSSGDLVVRGGRTERLSVRNSGSGSVAFAGSAEVAAVELSGSGDVSVRQAGRVERLQDSGSGDIQIGS